MITTASCPASLASAVAATTALTACSNPDEQEVVRPEGVPVSPFDASSTALEVTEGDLEPDWPEIVQRRSLEVGILPLRTAHHMIVVGAQHIAVEARGAQDGGGGDLDRGVVDQAGGLGGQRAVEGVADRGTRLLT